LSGFFAGLDRNARTGLAAGGLALGMVALGFAAVPLYRVFCQQTGFGGSTMRVSEVEAEAVHAATGQMISVRFDSNVSPNLPWQFRPERSNMRVTLGERQVAVFLAKNVSDRAITGVASFNVTPSQAGPHFFKIQCFCFSSQTLQPGQEVRMPVIFYVDPKIAQDPDANTVKEITLSYTFFPVDEAGTAA